MRAPTTHTVARVLVGGGIAGTVAAFALTVDRIRLLENPAFVPGCSWNAVLSCGSVMTSPQAQVFGFPNPLIGLMTFPVVTTLGVAVLAGAVLPAWMWRGLWLGTLAGVAFVHWLIVQSVYVIGALCPYCMVVWVATIAVFWYVTARTLAGAGPRAGRIAAMHGAVLTLWLLLIAAAAVTRFVPPGGG
ncbi:MAG: vitamin K epoxide reductase family protein [Pseudonocardia sp.]